MTVPKPASLPAVKRAPLIVATGILVGACGSSSTPPRALRPRPRAGHRGVAFDRERVRGRHRHRRSQGKTLYTFAPDKAKKVTCTGTCARCGRRSSRLRARSHGSGGAKASLVSSDTDPSGGSVVTYNGWPLYLTWRTQRGNRQRPGAQLQWRPLVRDHAVGASDQEEGRRRREHERQRVLTPISPRPARRIAAAIIRPMSAELGAILVPMVTPFDDCRVGWTRRPRCRLMNHLLDHGADGLVMCGTTGEAATLSDDEQLGLIGLAVERDGGAGHDRGRRGIQRHPSRGTPDRKGHRARCRRGALGQPVLQPPKPAGDRPAL